MINPVPLLFSQASSPSGKPIFPLAEIYRHGSPHGMLVDIQATTPEYNDFLLEFGITEAVCQQRVEEILILLFNGGYFIEERDQDGRIKKLSIDFPYTLPLESKGLWARFSNWCDRKMTSERVSLDCTRIDCGSDRREKTQLFMNHVHRLVRKLYVDHAVYQMFHEHMALKEHKKSNSLK